MKVGEMYYFPRINEKIYLGHDMSEEEADALHFLARHCGPLISFADVYLLEKVGRAKLYFKELTVRHFTHNDENSVETKLHKFCNQEFEEYTNKAGHKLENFTLDDRGFAINSRDLHMSRFNILIKHGWLKKWDDVESFYSTIPACRNNHWKEYEDFPWDFAGSN